MWIEFRHDERGPCSAIIEAKRVENVGGKSRKNVEENITRSGVRRNFKSLIAWISSRSQRFGVDSRKTWINWFL